MILKTTKTYGPPCTRSTSDQDISWVRPLGYTVSDKTLMQNFEWLWYHKTFKRMVK